MTEVLGQTSIELGFWIDLKDREQMFEHLTKDGCVTNFETRMRRKNGASITILASFTTMVFNNEPHNLAVIRDITHRKQTEEKLRIAKLKAEESERLKSAFLSNISHEIRTPMNAIMGLTELLLDENPPGSETNEYLKVILEKGGDLLSLMDNIIELSSIETEQIRFRYSRVSVNELLNDICLSYQPALKQKPAVDLIIGAREVITVTTDSEKLRSILKHLIENSLKFTDKGIVEVTAVTISGGFVEFTVSDTGIGIEDAQQSKVFERFRRTEGNESIKRGGAGIGLSISKSYVEALGGTIHLESKLGIGTTLRFKIENRVNEFDPVSPS